MENVIAVQGDANDKAITSVKDDSARQASQDLYAELDSNSCKKCESRPSTKSSVTAQSMETVQPDGFSVIPPYLLDEIAKRTGDGAFASAARDAENMQSHGSKIRSRANIAAGEHGAREVYDAKGQETQPGERARFEGEKPTGNTEVDKAYDYTGLVRDFYQKEYNRDSIDGDGMKFISTVDYGSNYNNAFWNGQQMTYGHPDATSPFKTFVLLDVTAHEITHGVTEKEANETYFGQAGALNESNSDVFGELIKQYSKNQTAGEADWLVGDGIWKDGINGRALRDMLHPGTAYDDPKIGKDPQPADMAHYVRKMADNGGVHFNSSIPNRAFATFAQAVGGHAWDDPGHIWFAARKAAGSDPSFSSFAYQTIEAAKALGKPDEVEKLQKAWDLVGVKPDANGKDTDTPDPNGDAKFTALDIIENEQKLINDPSNKTALKALHDDSVQLSTHNRDFAKDVEKELAKSNSDTLTSRTWASCWGNNHAGIDATFKNVKTGEVGEVISSSDSPTQVKLGATGTVSDIPKGSGDDAETDAKIMATNIERNEQTLADKPSDPNALKALFEESVELARHNRDFDKDVENELSKLNTDSHIAHTWANCWGDDHAGIDAAFNSKSGLVDIKASSDRPTTVFVF